MTAVGRHEKRSYYILVKEALIEKPLNEIMEKIGSDPLYYSAEDDDDPIGYKNNVQHKVAGKYDIDVIHTSNRVVLIVRAPEKEQKIFRELMRAYSKFQE